MKEIPKEIILEIKKDREAGMSAFGICSKYNINTKQWEKLEKEYENFINAMNKNGIVVKYDWTNFGTINDIFKGLPTGLVDCIRMLENE